MALLGALQISQVLLERLRRSSAISPVTSHRSPALQRLFDLVSALAAGGGTCLLPLHFALWLEPCGLLSGPGAALLASGSRATAWGSACAIATLRHQAREQVAQQPQQLSGKVAGAAQQPLSGRQGCHRRQITGQRSVASARALRVLRAGALFRAQINSSPLPCLALPPLGPRQPQPGAAALRPLGPRGLPGRAGWLGGRPPAAGLAAGQATGSAARLLPQRLLPQQQARPAQLPRGSRVTHQLTCYFRR